MKMTESELLTSKKPATVGLTLRLLAYLSKVVGENLTKHRDHTEELEKRLANAQETVDSLERRASRHAEHLARLETRLKALETR